MNRPAHVLRALLFGAVFQQAGLASAELPQPGLAEAPAITQTQAFAAWDTFHQDPLNRLDVAPTFLKFMQAGAVHTVLRDDVLFWMYAAYPQDVQAVLYATYMGANMEAQLRGAKRGDDPEAGISAVLDVWPLLKPRHPDLAMPRFDTWAAARQAGTLAAVLEAPAATP